LEKGTLKIPAIESLLGDSNMHDYLYDILKLERNKSIQASISEFMKSRIKTNIHDANQELFILKHKPAVYINSFSTFISPSLISRFRNDVICYKDVHISATESHSYSVFYNENTLESSKNTLLNILAYINGEPAFYFTENYNFNRKLIELYEQFDLLDILRLRRKNFFDSKMEEPFFLESPILISKNDYNLVCFTDTQHEMVFKLYHASLKQFEPMPRCVFLFRVFEYGVAHHYQPLMRPTNPNPVDILNYYVSEIFKHKYIPRFYVDAGRYVNQRKIVIKRKPRFVNFISKLKEEAKKITEEWKTHPYLRDKSIGEVIYATGRNASAHGASGRRTARYDYALNYKHINDVNVFLELISRYVIEQLNPGLAKMVEKKSSLYKEKSQFYKSLTNPIDTDIT
jgi:hypothetical protein